MTASRPGSGRPPCRPRIGCSWCRRLPRSQLPSPVRQDSAPECEAGASPHIPRGCRRGRTAVTTQHDPADATSPGGTMTTPTPGNVVHRPGARAAPGAGGRRADGARLRRRDPRRRRRRPCPRQGPDTRGRQRVHRGQRDPPAVRHRGGHQRQRPVRRRQAARPGHGPRHPDATRSGGCSPAPTSSSAASPRSPRPAPWWSPRPAEASCPATPAAPPARSGSSGRRRWCPTWAPRCAASRSTACRWRAPAPWRPTGSPAPSTALLILNAEPHPGRGTVLLLREAIGF